MSAALFAPWAMAWSPSPPSTLSDRVSIELEGHIEPTCELMRAQTGPNGARLDLSNLVDPRNGTLQAGNSSLQLRFNCNQRFTVSLDATNGELISQNWTPATDTAFLRTIAYRAEVTLAAGVATASRLCTPGILKSETCALRAPSDAFGAGHAQIDIAWDASPRPLLAGQYRDRIRVRISPSLGGE